MDPTKLLEALQAAGPSAGIGFAGRSSRSMTPLQAAQAMVDRWAESMGHPSPVPDVLRITLTAAVKERMATEIVALVEEGRGR